MKITEIIQSFLISLVLVFLLFCIFWSGVYSSYIKFYGVAEFFNPFFANVFNGALFLFLSAIFGVAFLIPFINRIFKFVYILLFLISMSCFVPLVGESIGYSLLSKTYNLELDGIQKEIIGLYENSKYIVYLEKIEVLETQENKKSTLRYYKKLIENTQ